MFEDINEPLNLAENGNSTKPLLCDVFSFGISTKKDTLTLRKSSYKILPKIKFKRKNEKRILLEKTDIASYKINIPFKIKKVKRSRSWLGDGFQSDDINCYSEWEEEIKVYDKENLSKFIIECFKNHNIDFDGRTSQNIA
jgi:hypothetical protein